MSNRLVILGATMFSSQLCVILKKEGYDVVGYTVDNTYINSDSFAGLPIFPFEELEDHVNISEVEIVITIGYTHMNDVRKAKYWECKKRGFKIFSFISQKSMVYTDKIGEGCIVMPGVYIGPFSQIGLCCVLWPGAILSHHNILDDFNWIASGCCFGGGASTGKNCFLGLGSTVRNEIEVSDYTFIGAQAYIGKTTLSKGVYLGVPAKLLPNMESFDMVSKV